MIPPTSIDGTDITGATIDGTDVTEITVDGDTVFTAGPPDTGMDHFYWAPSLSSVSTWPDLEGSNDATSFGSPSLSASGINGVQAVAYDGSNDYHETSSAGSLGATSEYTFVVVFELQSNSGFQSMLSNGTNGGFGGYRFFSDQVDDDFDIGHTGVDGARAGSVDLDPHVAVGTYDGSNATLDIDGSQVFDTPIGTPNSVNDHMTFGQRGDGTEFADVLIGALGHEAASANATRRDELTDLLADRFGITTST